MAPGWQARHRIASRAAYQAEFETMFNQGFRLIDVGGYAVDGQDHYTAIWDQAPGPAYAGTHFLDQGEHQQQFLTLTAQGFRPVSVSGYDAQGVARYAAVWELRGGPPLVARHHISSADMQALFEELKPQGFHPIDVCGFVVGNQVLFTALWELSPMAHWQISHDINVSQFLTFHSHNVAHGFVLRRVSGYVVGGQILYAAIWDKQGESIEPDITWTAEHNVILGEYQSKFDAMVRRGFRLVKSTGISLRGQDPRFTTIWHKPFLSTDDDNFIDTTIRTFMTTHNVPGVSAALAHRGRLVFARGYGIANPATNDPVTTGHLFRIASISKPITSVAIFTLIEAGRLNLGDRVFGPGALLGNTFGTAQPTPSGYLPNIDQITVQHLLEHTSGWPRATDPMFGNLALDQAGLIGLMLDMGLTNAPGSISDYLNFGYCVLGRIIEQVSGQSYADYVRQNVLAPCGITDMHIAGDTLADRRSNEVVYTPQGGNPYGIRVSRMDAHGGWIASATDLVRFLVRVDRFASKPDILASGTIGTMLTPTTALTPTGGTSNYAKGWATNTLGNYWHDGDIPGSISIFVRTHNQYCWAVLANSRNDAMLDQMRLDIDNLMHTVTGRITDWPAFDLF